MTLSDIATHTVDLQQIGITYATDYNVDKFIYFGTCQNIPSQLIAKRVSKFYSDYSPLEGYFLRVVIID